MEKDNIFTKLKHFYEKLFKRIINIIINPKVELKTILDENPKQTTLIFGYALFLGAIPFLSCIVFSLFKVQESDKHFYFVRGLIEFIFTFISIYFVSWIIELLANNFNSEKNYLRSIQLITFSLTPYYITGVLFLFGIQTTTIINVSGIYSYYIIYLGLPMFKKTPADKSIQYFIITSIILLAIRSIKTYAFGLLYELFIKFVWS